MACLLGLTGAWGCGDDGPADVAQARIGPDGGQISSVDGVLTVFLYPGALSETIDVTIQATDQPPPTYGPAYRVRPDVPVEIAAEVTYQYELPADRTRAAVVAIHREDFLNQQGYWTVLPRTELDIDDNLVSGSDTELAVFYALVDDAEGVASAPTSDSEASSGPSSTVGTTGPDPTAGDSEDTATAETGIGELSFAADIQPIFNANCGGTECHEVRTPALISNGYAAIVDVFPLSGASVPYVTPSEPENSYLMHKLDGTHTLDQNAGGCGCGGNGSSMPPTGMLDPGTRNIVRAWIEQGAPE
jgi:hypothetical protein